MFPQAKEPKSKLGYYRLLSPSSGVRVSPLCLGAMNFGSAWSSWMGAMDKKTAFDIMNHYYDNGGNFIDTSVNYQDHQSEQWIGEWMASRNNRDDIILATKYSSPNLALDEKRVNVNTSGNSKKNLHTSVEKSLRNLQTTYIDVLYIHWWDYTTPVAEVMQSLHHLVVSGKVLYLGVSDTPAWIVSKANQYARDHALTPFCVYQGEWSIAKRDFERDIIPMCKDEGMGFAVWGALGGGRFKTEEEIAEMEKSGEKGRQQRRPTTETEKKVTKIMDKLAKQKGTSITGIALSYVMQRTPYVYPIVGGRKISHLQDNIDALTKAVLTDAEIKELEEASPIDLGFPHSIVGNHQGQNMLINMAAKYSWIEDQKAIVFTPENK